MVKLEFKKSFGRVSVEGSFDFVTGFNLILGASGSGKTTTLRVIAGLERPEEGFMKCCDEVFFDVKRNIFLPPQKRKVGLVFQENNLMPHMTVRENVEFALKKSGDREVVGKFIREFGLEEIQNRYPDQISGGQKQKVAIVRALAYSPRMLLMDEPFSSLDFKTKMEIIAFLKSLDLKIPAVVVTHDPFEAFLLADKVFIMDSGKKVAEGEKEMIREFFKDLDKFCDILYKW